MFCTSCGRKLEGDSFGLCSVCNKDGPAASQSEPRESAATSKELAVLDPSADERRKYQVCYICPIKAGCSFSILFFAISVFVAPFIAIPLYYRQAEGKINIPWRALPGALGTISIFELIFGLILGMMLAALYNLVAHFLGGVEVELKLSKPKS